MEKELKVIDIKLGKGYFLKSSESMSFRIDLVVNKEIETSLEFRNFIAQKVTDFFSSNEKRKFIFCPVGSRHYGYEKNKVYEEDFTAHDSLSVSELVKQYPDDWREVK